jgi:hypothetical protein
MTTPSVVGIVIGSVRLVLYQSLFPGKTTLLFKQSLFLFLNPARFNLQQFPLLYVSVGHSLESGTFEQDFRNQRIENEGVRS